MRHIFIIIIVALTLSLSTASTVTGQQDDYFDLGLDNTPSKATTLFGVSLGMTRLEVGRLLQNEIYVGNNDFGEVYWYSLNSDQSTNYIRMVTYDYSGGRAIDLFTAEYGASVRGISIGNTADYVQSVLGPYETRQIYDSNYDWAYPSQNIRISIGKNDDRVNGLEVFDSNRVYY
ncbi:hypothetical protein HZC35_02980 [Candidatus Saganbacteria bacterium]|nr:hypothetical protein [Candidatus Saganbacteria bacterium]